MITYEQAFIDSYSSMCALLYCLCTKENEHGNIQSIGNVFFCAGTTAKVARDIADVSGGELFEIMPQNPYTDADLNWNNKQSRSSIEMGDATSRPALRNKKENISDYDIIFIGYPIWWNLAPRIINTFIEEHDLNGKVIIPFATSGGSGISNSVSALKEAYPSLNWKEGKLLNRANRNVIREWTVQFQ